MGRRRKPRNRTRVFVVQDKSGSMDRRRTATVSGFNEYIDELDSNAEGDIKISLLQFDTRVRDVFWDKRLEDVPELEYSDFVPGGMTALYDAVGRAISKAEESARPEDKVLIVIMTDGGENSSQRYNLHQILGKIERRRARGWEFVFLGAGEESWQAGQNLGFVGVHADKAIFYSGFDAADHSLVHNHLAATTRSYAGGQGATFDSTAKSSLEEKAKGELVGSR